MIKWDLDDPNPTGRGSQMAATPESELIRCPSCGATNRVAAERKRQGFEPVCGRCKTALSTESPQLHPITVTDATFAAEVERSLVPVLLDMWAPWCGPCLSLAPAIEQLASELVGKVKVAKLNIDDSPATAARFGVRSIPTLLVFKDGREVDRLVGLQSKSAILARLRHSTSL
jgi:thioredoxin 2